MNSISLTNKGKRETNQDVIFEANISIERNIYLLADGMGGYKNGRYAADFIVKHLFDILKSLNNFSEIVIQSAINDTVRALSNKCEEQNIKMGATLGGVINDKGIILCFWIGDVKIYHIRKGKILYESIEHTLKNELIEKKVFTEVENAKKYNHIVTRSIQNDITKSKIGFKTIENFKDGDFLILCSDGVTDSIENYQLLNILNSKISPSKKIIEIDAIIKKVALDNYSLILLY